MDEPFQYFVAMREASALGGIEVYGPFVDSSLAENFGEEKRTEYGEWEVCELEMPPASVEGTTEIQQHTITWWLRGDAPAELDESSVEHITKLIGEGFNQGELCVTGDDGETEYRGWWNIEQ